MRIASGRVEGGTLRGEGQPAGRRAVALRIAVATAVLVAGLIPASLARAAVFQPIEFQAYIGYCFGGGAESNQDVEITWRNADGVLKVAFTVRTSSFSPGSWSAPQSVCENRAVEIGDTIRAKVLGTGQDRTFTVPRLSLRFDRVTDVISGRAPANSTIRMSVYRCGFFICFLPPAMCPETDVPVDSSGRYTRDVTHCDGDYDAIGADSAEVTWISPFGDLVSRDGRAPFARVTVGSHRVTGATFASGAVSIQARRPDQTLRGTGTDTADTNGTFGATLRNASGNRVKVRIGDRVSGDWPGAGASFVVPNISVEIVGTTGDKVRGHCMPNVRYGIIVRRSDGASSNGGTTDGDGNTGLHDLDAEAGDVLTFICQRGSGDQIQVTRTF